MKGLFGQLEFQGRRDGMEDATSTLVTDEYGLWAVFDGHGGESCSQYCKEQVLVRISQYLEKGMHPVRALEEAFSTTDEDYCSLAKKLDLDDGSTATVLLLKDGEYFLAAAGDSRAVLVFSNGGVEPLSSDHKPDRRDERKRITNAGGHIEFDHDNETYRVFSDEVGGLAVTRAIGDAAFKPYVTAFPEIKHGRIDSTTRFIVLASDGLWDDVMNEEAGDVLTEMEQDLQGAAKELVHIAYSRGSEDNISIVAVDLQTWSSMTTAKEKERKEKRKKKDRNKEQDSSAPAETSKRSSKKQSKIKRTIPGLDEDGYLSELLLWKSPLRTFLWFSVGCLFFFLTYFANYSMLTLGSYLLLMQIVITTFVVKATPMLKRLRLLSEDFDSTLFVLQGTLLSDEVVKRASEVAHQVASNVFTKWSIIVQDGSATNILVALRFISYFFSPFSLDVVLFISFVALFSLPATYHHNQVFLDDQMHKIDVAYKKLLLRRSQRAY